MKLTAITRVPPGLLLGLLILFHLVSNLAWIVSDHSYPRGDEPLYLRKSLNLYRALAAPGPDTFGRLLRAEPANRVPFFPLLASPFYAVAGTGYRVACFSNSFFLLLLLFCVYRIGTRLGGRSAGLLAAVLVSLYPFSTDYVRKYWSDFALMAYFAFLFLLLMRTNLFRKRSWSLLFGAAAGAGILIKQFCAFYLLAVVIPAALIAWRSEFLRLHREGKKLIPALLQPTPVRLNLLAIGVLTTAISLPYYLIHLEEMRTVFLFGEASAYWTPILGRHRPAFWLWYLWRIPELTGGFGAAAFSLGLVFFLLRLKKSRFLLLCWLAGGYLVVSFFEAKLSRYASVLLPAMALVTALGLGEIRRAIWRRALIGLVLAGATAGYLWNTWSLTPRKLFPAWQDGGSWEKRQEALFSWDKPPQKTGDWRVENILEDIARGGAANPLIFVVPYLPYFFPETFRVAATAAGIECRVEGPGSPYGGFNFRFLLEADYIVTKEGELAGSKLDRLEFIEPAGALIAGPPESLAKNLLLTGEYPLPDGSRAWLYRRAAPATGREKVDLLQRVLQIDPGQVWGWNALGEALVDQDEAGEARKAFQEVVRLNPAWTGGYLGLGRAALAEGKLEEAERWVKRSLEITPDWPFAHFVQGMILEKSGDIAGAREAYGFALKYGRFDLPAQAEKALAGLEEQSGTP